MFRARCPGKNPSITIVKPFKAIDFQTLFPLFCNDFQVSTMFNAFIQCSSTSLFQGLYARAAARDPAALVAAAPRPRALPGRLSQRHGAGDVRHGVHGEGPLEEQKVIKSLRSSWPFNGSEGILDGLNGL